MEVFTDYAGVNAGKVLNREEVIELYKNKYVYVSPIPSYKTLWDKCRVLSVVEPQFDSMARTILFERYSACVLMDMTGDTPLYKMIHRPFG